MFGPNIILMVQNWLPIFFGVKKDLNLDMEKNIFFAVFFLYFEQKLREEKINQME